MIDSSLNQIVSYYDATKWDYRVLWHDRTSRALHFGYYDPGVASHAAALLNANRVLADLARIEQGKRVLDAGCGVGGTSIWLGSARQAEVVGITPVAHQVRFATNSARAAGMSDRVSFQCQDYTATNFADQSFDAVVALESLCHAGDKAAFYREAHRLLRPGGRLVVAEYVRNARPLVPNGETMLKEWLQGWAIPDIETEAEHTEHAAAAGFDDFVHRDFTDVTRRSLLRLHRIAWWTYPLAFLGRTFRLRTDVQHGNVIASIRQYEALLRDYWHYAVMSATRGT